MGGNGDDAVDRLVIRAVEPGCQESIDLQWEMRRELDAMYDETTIDPPPLEQFRLPRAAFLVAWLDGIPIGCGAITTLDESTAHFKRVFVRPGFRGHGFGRQVMKALEEKAAELGYTVLFLETADKQQEAISMYTSLGYQRVPCAGRVPCAEQSICFEKKI
ncbi:MAG: putative acetyltransferase [Methanomassiliicoccales archaeon PtaB.Bin215]|nr:MAG: putative acetyltransferase [Methanomassiliicoccales archaeon PtaB.Bin215]